MTTLSGVTSIDNDAATLDQRERCAAPDTTYWIGTGGADDGLSVATTSWDAVDAGGMAGFSVGNRLGRRSGHATGWADSAALSMRA